MVSFDFGELCVPMANALSESTSVLLVLPEHELEPLRDEVRAGVRVAPFAKPRLRQPVLQLRTAGKILRALKRFGPDVVHVQQGHLWFNLLVLPLLRRHPLVVTIHDPAAHLGDRGGQKTPQVVMNLAFERADQVIVHAERLKQEVVDRRGLDPNAVHVIPHVAIGQPRSSRAEREDESTVLFFGRIWPYKGLEFFIRAAPLIRRSVPNACFVIAGEGEDFARYQAMMHDPSAFTVINRFVSIDEREALFAKAAVVVLPYVEASQSGVVPVAYAFAKPVVATDVGGLPEVVEHGRTGLVVPPRDEQALADAVVRLLVDEDLRYELGRAGHRRLEDEWSATGVTAPMLRVYELAWRQQQSGPGGGVAAVEMQASAEALHRHLLERHWRGDGLVGPDFGVRLNYRVGRFVKSYLRARRWHDDLYYLQAQAYWVLANWELHAATGDASAAEVALACSRGMATRQRQDGAWDYPNPEWRGRVATAEGSWAAIALAETYRRTGDASVLESAVRWHRFLEEDVGYQRALGGLAVNYFAGKEGSAIPNNSAFVLRMLAELADATGDERFLARAPALVEFLAASQRASGELPYEIDPAGNVVRLHFQCSQYNAFQCLDLLRYGRLTQDTEVEPMVRGLLRFLAGKVEASGDVRYACDASTPHVTYHGAAVAAALSEGQHVGVDGYTQPAVSAAHRLLTLQRPDGSFPHSRRDYSLLHDLRVYPRPSAMILHHLLVLRRALENAEPALMTSTVSMAR